MNPSNCTTYQLLYLCATKHWFCQIIVVTLKKQLFSVKILTIVMKTINLFYLDFWHFYVQKVNQGSLSRLGVIEKNSAVFSWNWFYKEQTIKGEETNSSLLIFCCAKYHSHSPACNILPILLMCPHTMMYLCNKYWSQYTALSDGQWLDRQISFLNKVRLKMRKKDIKSVTILQGLGVGPGSATERWPCRKNARKSDFFL